MLQYRFQDDNDDTGKWADVLLGTDWLVTVDNLLSGPIVERVSIDLRTGDTIEYRKAE